MIEFLQTLIVRGECKPLHTQVPSTFFYSPFFIHNFTLNTSFIGHLLFYLREGHNTKPIVKQLNWFQVFILINHYLVFSKSQLFDVPFFVKWSCDIYLQLYLSKNLSKKQFISKFNSIWWLILDIIWLFKKNLCYVITMLLQIIFKWNFYLEPRKTNHITLHWPN